MFGYFNLNLISVLEKKQRDSWHYNNYSPWSADYAGQFSRDGYKKLVQTPTIMSRTRLIAMSSERGCYLKPDIKRLYVAWAGLSPMFNISS